MSNKKWFVCRTVMTQKALYYTQNVCSYDAQNFKKDASFVKV